MKKLQEWTWDERTVGTEPGPWDHEPDKRQWIDAATDLDCLMVRNRMGGWCGYVGVPPGHVLYGRRYSDCPDLEVHGGLTFADRCTESEKPERTICHVPEPGRPEDVWWFGFDCGHSMDFLPGIANAIRDVVGLVGYRGAYRHVAYVEEEVAALAAQLAAVTEWTPPERWDDA